MIGHTAGLLLCPLDVTVRMRPSVADGLDALVDAAPVLGTMLEDRRARQERADGVTDDEVAVRLHDPLAWALAGEPVVTSEPRPLVVDGQGHVHEDPGRGRVVDVVSDVDAVRAMERFVDSSRSRIGGGEVQPSPTSPVAQGIERQTSNLRVGGSNPSGRTNEGPTSDRAPVAHARLVLECDGLRPGPPSPEALFGIRLPTACRPQRRNPGITA